jgi:hypothetical protein
MKQRIWMAVSAVTSAIAIVIAAIAIPQMAGAGVTGAVGNGPMVFQSGTYTPTMGTTTNVASYTFHAAQWTRVGDVVHIEGRVDVQVSSNSGLPLTFVRLSLPVASNLSTSDDLNGTAFIDDNFVPTSGGFDGATGTNASLYYYSNAANTTDQKRINYSFSYVVK